MQQSIFEREEVPKEFVRIPLSLCRGNETEVSLAVLQGPLDAIGLKRLDRMFGSDPLDGIGMWAEVMLELVSVGGTPRWERELSYYHGALALRVVGENVVQWYVFFLPPGYTGGAETRILERHLGSPTSILEVSSIHVPFSGGSISCDDVTHAGLRGILENIHIATVSHSWWSCSGDPELGLTELRRGKALRRLNWLTVTGELHDTREICILGRYYEALACWLDREGFRVTWYTHDAGYSHLTPGVDRIVLPLLALSVVPMGSAEIVVVMEDADLLCLPRKATEILFWSNGGAVPIATCSSVNDGAKACALRTIPDDPTCEISGRTYASHCSSVVEYVRSDGYVAIRGDPRIQSHPVVNFPLKAFDAMPAYKFKEWKAGLVTGRSQPVHPFLVYHGGILFRLIVVIRGAPYEGLAPGLSRLSRVEVSTQHGMLVPVFLGKNVRAPGPMLRKMGAALDRFGRSRSTVVITSLGNVKQIIDLIASLVGNSVRNLDVGKVLNVLVLQDSWEGAEKNANTCGSCGMSPGFQMLGCYHYVCQECMDYVYDGGCYCYPDVERQTATCGSWAALHTLTIRSFVALNV